MLKKELSVVVPVYNEEASVASVVEKIDQTLKASGWQYEILIVNDGSTDKTESAARQTNAKVISHPKNMGYGAALRTGILAASYDFVATIDGDLAYPAEEILKLLPYTETFDMVVGARQGSHYWGSLFKYPARLIFLAIASFVVGERIPDVNSGLRIFKKSKVTPMLPRLCAGFSFSTTLTLSFLSSHYFVRFEPIEYSSRLGTSKVRYFRDTLRTLQLILETVVYYNPIKASLLLILPATAVSVISLLAFLNTAADIYFYGFLITFCCSLLLFALGFILYMLSQLNRSNDQSR